MSQLNLSTNDNNDTSHNNNMSHKMSNANKDNDTNLNNTGKVCFIIVIFLLLLNLTL